MWWYLWPKITFKTVQEFPTVSLDFTRISLPCLSLTGYTHSTCPERHKQHRSCTASLCRPRMRRWCSALKHEQRFPIKGLHAETMLPSFVVFSPETRGTVSSHGAACRDNAALFCGVQSWNTNDFRSRGCIQRRHCPLLLMFSPETRATVSSQVAAFRDDTAPFCWCSVLKHEQWFLVKRLHSETTLPPSVDVQPWNTRNGF